MIRLRRQGSTDCGITVNDIDVPARAGEPLLATIGAAPGGCGAGLPAFCGMGVCFACLVTVDGRSGVRACTTRVEPGMRVHVAVGDGGHRG